MINNRQGGRRRGRGGQRGQSLGGQGQPGNRQDNRQRGNAAQLLEKYKNMARDSQLAGDRVQTEYYLQFADHYFRVLGESRARFDDQRRQRGEDLDDEDDGDDEMLEAGDEQGSAEDDNRDRGERFQRDRGRNERSDRAERPERPERSDRAERSERRPQRNEERAAADGGDGADRRPGRMNGGETIPFDALPPAIGRDEPEADEAALEEPRRPRRRTRAPRATEGDDEAPPAA